MNTLWSPKTWDAVDDPNDGGSGMEPYVGMEFESEEAAKVFYDAYAAH